MYRCVNDFHWLFFYTILADSWAGGSFFDLNAFQDLSGTSQIQCLQARSENGLSLAFLQSVQRLYTRRFFVVISLFYNRYYNIIWLVILIFSVLFNPNMEWIYLKRSTETGAPLWCSAADLIDVCKKPKISGRSRKCAQMTVKIVKHDLYLSS